MLSIWTSLKMCLLGKELNLFSVYQTTNFGLVITNRTFTNKGLACDRIEKILGKGENASYRYFLQI